MANAIKQKDLFRTLTVLFAAQVIAVLIFAGITFFLSGNISLDAERARMYKYLLLALVPGGYVAGNFIYKKKLASLSIDEGMKSKVSKLQSSMLIRWACNEVPAMVAGYTAFATGDITLLLFAGISIALMVTLRPNKETITGELPLTESERSLMADPDAVLYTIGKE